MTRKNPAAKLDSKPAHATPIATPAAAMKAAKLEVSSPKKPSKPASKAIFSAADKKFLL